jgi:hypothetical protein
MVGFSAVNPLIYSYKIWVMVIATHSGHPAGIGQNEKELAFFLPGKFAFQTGNSGKIWSSREAIRPRISGRIRKSG